MPGFSLLKEGGIMCLRGQFETGKDKGRTGGGTGNGSYAACAVNRLCGRG